MYSYIYTYIYHIVEKISIKRNQTSLLISERSELDYLILSYKLHYWLYQNWLVKIIQIGKGQTIVKPDTFIS